MHRRIWLCIIWSWVGSNTCTQSCGNTELFPFPKDPSKINTKSKSSGMLIEVLWFVMSLWLSYSSINDLKSPVQTGKRNTILGSSGYRRTLIGQANCILRLRLLGSIDSLFNLGNAYGHDVVREFQKSRQKGYPVLDKGRNARTHVGSRHNLGCEDGKGNHEWPLSEAFPDLSEHGAYGFTWNYQDLFMGGIASKAQYTPGAERIPRRRGENGHDRDLSNIFLRT